MAHNLMEEVRHKALLQVFINYLAPLTTGY